MLIAKADLKIGDVIYKEGYSLGYQYGTVVSKSETMWVNGIPISDALQTTIPNYLGDSGGVVYDKNEKIVGTMSVSTYSSTTIFDESTFLYSYVCKVENELKSLGCSIDGKFD